MRKTKGLTLLEVLISISLLGIVVSLFTTSFVTTLQQENIAGERTQAVRFLDYLGRLVVGNAEVLTREDDLVWDYGELSGTFKELKDVGGFTNPDSFRATITSPGTIGMAGVSLTHYNIEVCWTEPSGEICVDADTIAPQLVKNNASAPPPVVN